MMTPRGRTLPLSLPRRMICDLVYFACKVPSIPVEREMNLAALAHVRGQIPDRPGWSAILLKAFALAAAEHPELRRAYMSLPRPRLYEHPESVASVAIERQYGGENAVFLAQIRVPDRRSLADLQGYFDRFRSCPIEADGVFRRALRISRLPRPLRRLLWWIGLNHSGRRRARHMGTFALSVYSGLGADSLHPLSPLTSTLNYGVIGPDGAVRVRITYDHRVMDGATVARALASMERALHGPILSELTAMHDAALPAAAA